MASLFDRNKLLLLKIESSEGVDAAPSTANAILVENLRIRPGVNNLTTNEHTGALDGAADIPAGAPVQITFDMYLQGAAAAGSAPPAGVPLRICGLQEILTAVAVGAPTAAVAGTTTTVTLPSATFVGATDAYKGMPIILSGNPATATDTAITDWNAAATPVATLADSFATLTTTSLATIPANALYVPRSSGIESATAWVYESGLLYKVTGCRGDFTFRLDAGGLGMWSFTLTGIMGGKSDAAVPSVGTFPGNTGGKMVWNNRNSQSAMKLDRTSIAVTQLSFGFGNSIVNPPNPNQADGFDVAEITARQIRGQINPKATLVAVRDLLTNYRDADTVLLTVRTGRSLGNRCAITVFDAQISGFSEESQNGILGEMIPWKANGTDRHTIAIAFY